MKRYLHNPNEELRRLERQYATEPRRQNPDMHMRQLERQAMAGGFEDKLHYLQYLVRQGDVNLSDYYTIAAIEDLYMQFVPAIHGRQYLRTFSANELPLLSLPLIWMLLHDTSPGKPDWLDRHLIAALGGLKQGTLLTRFLVFKNGRRFTD